MKGLLDWRVPAAVLLFLFIASVTRWQTEATYRQTDFPPTVIYWKRDRWTNTRWITRYDLQGYSQTPVPGTWSSQLLIPEEKVVSLFSVAWAILVVLNTVWLLAALIRRMIVNINRSPTSVE
ncbi:MAG: hypothetical protein RMM08_08890 [Armatimonadota bacterium]|nr:hypothetical protein [bacterium]MDW8321467.1 hypothetical protein [Armatimonadota bacterium]